MSRLLLDEMLSATIAAQLRERGHEVVAVVETPGLLGTPDADILDQAEQQGRILVTLNISDFVALDRTWRSAGRTHHGILLVSTVKFRQDRAFIGRLVGGLADALTRTTLPGPGAIDFL